MDEAILKLSEASAFSLYPIIKKEMKVVEIGVRSGQSSHFFLAMGCFVYMVDPWAAYDEYLESAYYRFEEDYEVALGRAANYPGKYKIIRKKSTDVSLDDVPDFLDLVYIDGNHSYKYVTLDINKWWPKIKQGGYLTGDDWRQDEVRHAVSDKLFELASENIEFRFKLYDRNWVIQKL